tara:strand:+ start:301 stop:888 length:588 start_codon:yes stop_codon:yes gene_type:complete
MSQLNVDSIRNSAGSGGELSLSGGDFNFDSNTLFVDVSADKVGIGTGTPAAALDVRESGGVMLHTSPLMEKVNIVAGEVNATTDIDALTSAVWQFTTAGTANWTHNIRGDGSTALNAILEVGQVATITIMSALGSSSGYSSALNIDGVSQTVLWSGGSAPSEAGDTSGYDVYSYSIVKKANGSYDVFGSTNTFKS